MGVKFMNKKKWFTLGAVGAALLLLPRRSSWQATRNAKDEFKKDDTKTDSPRNKDSQNKDLQNKDFDETK